MYHTPTPFGIRSFTVTLNAVFAPPFEKQITKSTSPPADAVTCVGVPSFHRNIAGFATSIFAVAE